GTDAARGRAIRDVSYVARQEALHILHVLASGAPASPSAAPTSTPQPSPTTTSTQKPASSNKLCPEVLHDKGWGKVSLRPDRYVGCQVDIAAQVYGTQTLDSS